MKFCWTVILLSLLVGRYSIAQNQTTENRVNQSESSISGETLKSRFKVRGELRGWNNSFANTASVSNFRLRIDPSWTIGSWVLGFRQDLRNSFSGGKNHYTLDNTRTFYGINFQTNGFGINPRAEIWLPTNVADRSRLSYQGSPGLALKIKKGWNRFTSNVELNFRKMFYDTKKASYTDLIAFYEFKNQYNVTDSVALNLNLKVEDQWNQTATHSQKYQFEQSAGMIVAKNMELELGHFVEKPLLKNGRPEAFVVYDKEISQVYLQASITY